MYFSKLSGESVVALARKSIDKTLGSFLPGLSNQINNNMPSYKAAADFLDEIFLKAFNMGKEYSCVESSYCYEVLRQKNRVEENKLLNISGGIPTLHGAMFSMGLMCTTAGRLDALGIEFQLDYLTATIADFAKNYSLKSFINLDIKTSELTAGEKLFQVAGKTSIRGLAELGFEPVLTKGLSYLKENKGTLNDDDLSTGLFLSLVSILDDSRIILQHGDSVMSDVQARANEIATTFNRTAAQDFDRYLVEKSIVPKAALAMHSLCLFTNELLAL